MQAIAKVKIWIVILMIFCGKNIMPFFWVTWNEPYVEAPFSVEGSSLSQNRPKPYFSVRGKSRTFRPRGFPGGPSVVVSGHFPVKYEI